MQGKLLEIVPNQSLRIQLDKENILTLPLTQVDSIKFKHSLKQTKFYPFKPKGHVYIEGVLGIGNYPSVGLLLSYTYAFNRCFTLGAGIGDLDQSWDGLNHNIPLYTITRFDFTRRKISPCLQNELGATILGEVEAFWMLNGGVSIHQKKNHALLLLCGLRIQDAETLFDTKIGYSF